MTLDKAFEQLTDALNTVRTIESELNENPLNNPLPLRAAGEAREGLRELRDILNHRAVAQGFTQEVARS